MFILGIKVMVSTKQPVNIIIEWWKNMFYIDAEIFYIQQCAEEFMLSNCGIGEDPWESLGKQGD